jgi:hypothetical protein
LWFAAIALLAGCKVVEDSPPEKCDRMLEQVCDRLEGCVTDMTNESLPSDWQQTCLDGLSTEIDCSSAAEVDDDAYDSCTDSLNSLGCNVLFDFAAVATGSQGVNLPLACIGAFEFD